jgi:small subunit ribosomal protein S2
MNQTGSEASASEQEGGVSETASALEKQELTIRELLEAGVHFGHQTHRWNPSMKRFLFGERNGVHIVDLDQSLPRFQEALDFVCDEVAAGGKVLFVGTKRQAQAPIQLEAARAGQFYVNNRWLGGMLTNFKTVKKSIERYKELLETLSDEEKVKEFSKKELSRFTRLSEKYRKSLEGMKEMTRLPDVLFVIDVNREAIAVSEGRRLGIPIVAVVDSNCSPEGIDFVIPGNDDSLRAIQLYCSRMANACLQGEALHQERIKAEVADAERRKAEQAAEEAAAPKGRVVVEIAPEERGGRGPASFGGRRDEASAAARPAPAPAPAPAAESPAPASESPAPGGKSAAAAESPAAGGESAAAAESPAAGDESPAPAAGSAPAAPGEQK